MVSLFENYEQQYSALTADITAQVGLLTASATSKYIFHLENRFSFLICRGSAAVNIQHRKTCGGSSRIGENFSILMFN